MKRRNTGEITGINDRLSPLVKYNIMSWEWEAVQSSKMKLMLSAFDVSLTLVIFVSSLHSVLPKNPVVLTFDSMNSVILLLFLSFLLWRENESQLQWLFSCWESILAWHFKDTTLTRQECRQKVNTQQNRLQNQGKLTHIRRWFLVFLSVCVLRQWFQFTLNLVCSLFVFVSLVCCVFLSCN